MPRVKLSARSVAQLIAPDPSNRQIIHWDSELKGFGVLCSGTTEAKVYVVQRDINRRTRRVTIAPTNVLSIMEARKRAESVLADLYKGIDPKAGRRQAITLAEVFDSYVAAKGSLAEKSISLYRKLLKNLSSWHDKPLRDITPDDVEARFRAIVSEVVAKHATKHFKGERPSGKITANATMRLLKILFNFAKGRHPTLPPNPVLRLALEDQWHTERVRTNHVEDAQLPAFYGAVMALPNEVHRDFLRLILFTGMRRFEASCLRWDYIDLSERTIRIPAEITKAKRSDFVLPMSEPVYDMLVARRALGNETFVFPANSKTGHLMDVQFSLDIIARQTGICVSTHDLRRTFLTVAESCDIAMMPLKALVNHRLGDVTSNYIQMKSERVREAAQRVADRMQELCAIAPIAGHNVQKLR